MTIYEFKSKATQVKNRVVRPLNGWGFGGILSDDFIIGEHKLCVYTHYHRHSISKDIGYFINGVLVNSNEFKKSISNL